MLLATLTVGAKGTVAPDVRHRHHTMFIVKTEKKNKLKILTNYGLTGIFVDYENQTTILYRDVVLGLGYERQFNEDISLDFNYFRNGDFMFGVGYAF